MSKEECFWCKGTGKAKPKFSITKMMGFHFLSYLLFIVVFFTALHFFGNYIGGVVALLLLLILYFSDIFAMFADLFAKIFVSIFSGSKFLLKDPAPCPHCSKDRLEELNK